MCGVSKSLPTCGTSRVVLSTCICPLSPLSSSSSEKREKAFVGDQVYGSKS